MARECRNHKCRIHKNYQINGMEALIMENEKLRVTILVDKGTDIIEFLYKPKDMDFLFKSPRGLPQPRKFVAENPDDMFQSIYEGGWQEAFPSASGGGIYRGAAFPFHGEAFLRRWEYEIVKDEEEEISVRFTLHSDKLPLVLEKQLTMKANEPCVYFTERVTNESEEDIHFMWGHHPAFGGLFLDENVTIHIPAKRVHHLKGGFSEGAVVKAAEKNDSWPVMEKGTGTPGTIDMSKVLPPQAKERAMIILSELEKGEYLLFNAAHQVGFGLAWNLQQMPYVWLWANYRGERDYPWFGKAYALAVEPFTSRVETGIDSLNETIANGTAAFVKAGESIDFTMKAFATETNSWETK